MFYIVNWITNEVLQKYESLSKAKRECRKIGYDVLPDGRKAPIAYVSDGTKASGLYTLEYNPRFK